MFDKNYPAPAECCHKNTTIIYVSTINQGMSRAGVTKQFIQANKDKG
jgi:hypothetical protein